MRHLRPIVGAAAGVAGLAAGVVLVGCSAEAPLEYASASQEESAPLTTTLDAASLPRGEHEIRTPTATGERHLDVLANDAPLDALLGELSERLGFELVLAPGERPLVFVAFSALPLPDALATLLAGLDYEARWSPADAGSGPASESRRLRWLSVAAAAEMAQPDPDPGVATAPGPRPEARRPIPRVREQSEEQQRLNAQLRDSDPEVRSTAVIETELEGGALRQLIVMARSDEDPEVRALVVQQLEDADGYAAVATMVGALDDPDERVVLAAIEALSFSGDESVIPELERMREHRDIEVREAADEAIELLE